MLLPLVIAATLATPEPGHVAVAARFLPPPSAGADGAVAVTLTPVLPGIVVNEQPAPRLKLDPAQVVLVDRQPPRAPSTAPIDPSQARYLDPRVPVRFPVALAAGAPRGTHAVRASVTYFYCSKSEGWCRKGTGEISVDVTVP